MEFIRYVQARADNLENVFACLSHNSILAFLVKWIQNHYPNDASPWKAKFDKLTMNSGQILLELDRPTRVEKHVWYDSKCGDSSSSRLIWPVELRPTKAPKVLFSFFSFFSVLLLEKVSSPLAFLVRSEMAEAQGESDKTLTLAEVRPSFFF